ncbi:MAG TPA: 3'-5' exonuclease [Candidatus Dormibacteraeota bacterium]|nr:3'-5' exonuclease [Candidatus Dormibacteraeota bacterium]
MQLPSPDESPSREEEPASTDAAPPAKLKLKWGRERGPGAPGDGLVARLGPPTPELAGLHNRRPEFDSANSPEDSQLPRLPLETSIDQIPFVALDCETTGHFPDRMVELGAVRFRLAPAADRADGRLLFETLVHTTDHINPYARRVHGITRSMLTGTPSLRTVATAFHDFSRGAIMVEHSADSFDTRLVSKAMNRPMPHHHLDTSRIAGFLFQLRDTIGLERLCERLGVTHRQPHFALADAEATADCFCALVKLGLEEFGWRTLGDLVLVGMPPSPRPAVPPGRRPSGPTAPTADGTAPRRRRHRAGRRHRPASTPAVDQVETEGG